MLPGVVIEDADGAAVLVEEEDLSRNPGMCRHWP